MRFKGVVEQVSVSCEGWEGERASEGLSLQSHVFFLCRWG